MREGEGKKNRVARVRTGLTGRLLLPEERRRTMTWASEPRESDISFFAQTFSPEKGAQRSATACEREREEREEAMATGQDKRGRGRTDDEDLGERAGRHGAE